MGQVQRDSIERLRHAKKYSGFFGTICTNMAWTGYVMATGALRGPDPREMAKSDCVVIWGTNAVSTQVNVMTHAVKARKERGAKIVVIDIYDNPTMKQADMALTVRPGTDAALACAVMHVAFRDGYADRAYMAAICRRPAGLEAHLKAKTPEWASAITGLSVEEIETFARLVGTTQKTFSGWATVSPARGTARSPSMPQPSIATVLGCWQYEGGGAFHNNGEIFRLNKSELMGTALPIPISAARPVADRPGSDRRCRSTAPSRAGDGAADPEHQPDERRTGTAPRPSGLLARRPVRRGARAVHDRYGRSRRYRPAGNDVRRA
jgi:anaerobic selenocysteine-containing dehydrogenase